MLNSNKLMALAFLLAIIIFANAERTPVQTFRKNSTKPVAVDNFHYTAL